METAKKFDPEYHTKEWFNKFKEKHNGNVSSMAKELGISRKTFYVWKKKIANTKTPKSHTPKKRKPKKSTPIKRNEKQIPTVNDIYNWLNKHPDYIDYEYFMMKNHLKKNKALIRATIEIIKTIMEE